MQTASTVGPINIYTGAGLNDIINKGTVVGSVIYYYASLWGTNVIASVQAQITKYRCKASKAHIYIGDKLPSNIDANGLFPFYLENLTNGQWYTIPQSGAIFSDANLNGLYYIAHFEVCCQIRSAVP